MERRVWKKGSKNRRCNGPGGFGAAGINPDGLRVVVAVGGMKLDGLKNLGVSWDFWGSARDR